MEHKEQWQRLLKIVRVKCKRCKERHNIWPGMHIQHHDDGTTTYRIDYWCKRCLDKRILKYHTAEFTE